MSLVKEPLILKISLIIQALYDKRKNLRLGEVNSVGEGMLLSQVK